MSKVSGYVCAYDQSVTGNLITGYMASGVKSAGMQYRQFYGTSEVIVAPPNPKRGNGRQRVRRDNGGRPGYSSDEVPVMGMERRTRLVWCQTNLQPLKRDDRLF